MFVDRDDCEKQLSNSYGPLWLVMWGIVKDLNFVS